ncbi:MAG: MBL fold metallo-hydrolase [Ruminococcus sp.]|nr:MBL fold metallo-hydrolase [Ruminococcus sp.]MCM1381789.1 MBL fold metallo-hydrolase [Muribaculaceae bacterium]MCM1479450.1 MBL fold metallo-hydrolase [Muribaculaceae bacterium]
MAQRKTPSKTARKSSGTSPVLTAILIVLCFIFLYSAYLELGTDSVPEAAVNSFIQKDADLEIHFIDVGQGDCSLIMWEGAAMLIDCGEREQAETVLKYLKKQGVKKLDYIVATHPHSDHIGGMGDIISAVEVEKVIAPRVTDDMTPTTKTYERFLKALSDKALRLTAAKPGTTYTLGTSAEGKTPPKFEIIAPVDDYDDLNNYSVVIRLTYGGTSYLFTGDAEKQAESDILKSGAELNSDVLKVGHHGSSTSTSEDFYNEVSPKICIIQCGSDNSYGHPHKETMETIENSGAKVYRNDTDGTVIVYSDGDEIFVKTEKENSNQKNNKKEDAE